MKRFLLHWSIRILISSLCMLQFGALDSGEGGNSFQAKMQWRCSPSRLDRCQCHKMWQVLSYRNSDWYWIQYLFGYNFVSYKPTSSISVLLKKYQVFRFNMCKVSVRNSRKKIEKTPICIALLIKHCSQVAAKSQTGPEAVAAAGSPLYYVRPRWCQCFDDCELNGAASSWPSNHKVSIKIQDQSRAMEAQQSSWQDEGWKRSKSSRCMLKLTHFKRAVFVAVEPQWKQNQKKKCLCDLLLAQSSQSWIVDQHVKNIDGSSTILSNYFQVINWIHCKSLCKFNSAQRVIRVILSFKFSLLVWNVRQLALSWSVLRPACPWGAIESCLHQAASGRNWPCQWNQWRSLRCFPKKRWEPRKHEITLWFRPCWGYHRSKQHAFFVK